MYFKKLNYQFTTNPITIKDPIIFHGDSYPYGIHYNKIDNNNDHLFSIIPEQYRKHFKLAFLKINIPYVPPHNDSDMITSINFYINPSNYSTNFYEVISSNPKCYRVGNQTNGRVFELSDIECRASFIALPGEVFILNVSKIHDVAGQENQPDRTAIVMNSNTLSYHDTLEILEQQNLI
jgi:hypothetical protein